MPLSSPPGKSLGTDADELRYRVFARWLSGTGHRLWCTAFGAEYDDSDRVPTEDLDDANCVGSLCADGRHRPALDVDVPVLLFPSSNAGHYHVYIDAPMPWRRYKRLLKALAKAGIIEPGYYKASTKRKQSFLRLPWVKKEAT